ncbi:hypothetical protein TCAL_12433 [Tigriopus californicus]|uniref:Inactive serine protease scarface clip-domain domain-containing protein n=1 Tax=Tigriopus californicus TaxID=6832 RepID=A0A553PIB3_TIGCA|nr:hypothetical protein TCAL_12433 [Tigriopus californicus]
MKLLLISMGLLAVAHAGEKYWWMNKGVFGGASGGGGGRGGGSSGNGGCCGGNGGHNSNQGQGNYNDYQPQQQQQQQQQGSNNNHNNQNFGGSSSVQTECPAGTKCVSDFFCDENAVMVSYRVSLTPAQKRNRGNLLPCMNQQTGQFDVCCSTSSGSSGGNQVQSNCWSVGQADVDCPNSELCCFDGCRNACYFRGNENAPRPGQQQPFQPAPAPQQPQRPQPPPPQQQRPQPTPPGPRPSPPPQQQQQSQSQDNFQDPPPIPTPAPQQPYNPPPPPQQTFNPPTQQQQQQQQSFNPPPPQRQQQQQQQQRPSPSTGQCPNINALPFEDCESERDTCWNTDRRDDCARGFLCCNDGCVKTCYNTNTGDFLRHPQSKLSSESQAGSPPASLPAQQPARRPSNNARPSNQNNFRAPVPQNNNNNNFGSQNNFQPAPPRQNNNNFSPPRQSPSNSFNSQPSANNNNNNYNPPQTSHSSNGNTNIQFPQPSRNNFNKPRPAPQQSFNSAPQSQGSRNNFQSNGPQPQADEKPFVMCPSAMLCVPRENCDLKGFITTQSLALTPQLEMLRVATIGVRSPDRFFFSFLGENVESGSVAREVSPSPSENVWFPSVSSPL